MPGGHLDQLVVQKKLIIGKFQLHYTFEVDPATRRQAQRFFDAKSLCDDNAALDNALYFDVKTVAQVGQRLPVGWGCGPEFDEHLV